MNVGIAFYHCMYIYVLIIITVIIYIYLRYVLLLEIRFTHFRFIHQNNSLEISIIFVGLQYISKIRKHLTVIHRTPSQSCEFVIRNPFAISDENQKREKVKKEKKGRKERNLKICFFILLFILPFSLFHSHFLLDSLFLILPFIRFFSCFANGSQLQLGV